MLLQQMLPSHDDADIQLPMLLTKFLFSGFFKWFFHCLVHVASNVHMCSETSFKSEQTNVYINICTYIYIIQLATVFVVLFFFFFFFSQCLFTLRVRLFVFGG